jgi:hypothetical protein
MMIDVDTSELVALAAELSAAGPAAKVKAVAAVRAAAEVTASAARSAAPVLTGELRGSIFVRGEGDAAIVGSDVRQGFFQEFGTSRHPPQAWLFPSSVQGERRLVDGLEKIEPL